MELDFAVDDEFSDFGEDTQQECEHFNTRARTLAHSQMLTLIRIGQVYAYIQSH